MEIGDKVKTRLYTTQGKPVPVTGEIKEKDHFGGGNAFTRYLVELDESGEMIWVSRVEGVDN